MLEQSRALRNRFRLHDCFGAGRVRTGPQYQTASANYPHQDLTPQVYPGWTRQTVISTMHPIHLNVSICVVKYRPIC